MIVERKCFETKSISGYSYFDYWDLKNHPLFISFSKSHKPHYIHFDEVPFENCIKVSNLSDVRDALYKNEWAFEERYWKAISKHIQTMINIPWT